MASFRRLAKDHAALQHSPPPNYLFPESDDAASLPDDLTQLSILITGAQDTPYSEGLWRLHLKIPTDYPKNPPKATFKTRIYHPNVEESTGVVCLETLKRDWDPKLTLKDILVTISCLLIQPNPDSALNAAAGAQIQDDYEAFSSHAKLMARIHAPIPKHLVKAVQEAKRRGEDEKDEVRTLPNPNGKEVQISLEAPEEDNTKENGPDRPSTSQQQPVAVLRTNSRAKRPLSEVSSSPDWDLYSVTTDERSAFSDAGQSKVSPPSIPHVARPMRKSPKLMGIYTSITDGMSEAAVLETHISRDEEKENLASVVGNLEKGTSVVPALLVSRPTAFRKGSIAATGRRGQPRVGIRRL